MKLIQLILRLILTPVFLVVAIACFVAAWVAIIPLFCALSFASDGNIDREEVHTIGVDFPLFLVKQLWDR